MLDVLSPPSFLPVSSNEYIQSPAEGILSSITEETTNTSQQPIRNLVAFELGGEEEGPYVEDPDLRIPGTIIYSRNVTS